MYVETSVLRDRGWSEERIKRARAEVEADDRRAIAAARRRDMAEAHAEGLHDDLAREGCPECPRQRRR